ncbi:MAG: hypothetical protein OEY22_02215 [Candidatus Bathyarchaeota archaeon]|nr:hypothetical protein [Candidatus Bathyarchaeota archaeon]
MLGRKKIVIVSLLLVYAFAVPVFANMYFYSTELKYIAAGVILQSYSTPTMQLGFYKDAACTQLLDVIDFGNMTHPNQETILWRQVFIRNEGDVWIDIYWNSTLNTVTNEIQEWWDRASGPNWGLGALNGTRTQPGEVRDSWYGIKIPAYATVGTYNWTLTVWGENYY